MKTKKFGMILPITLLAYFLILMDNSIIFTSSVQIGESLNLTPVSLAWISNAYTLTFGGFLLLSGRLSDLLGRKRIFQIGLAIFGISSLVIGLAQSDTVMIITRAIQGIGSSIIAPTTLALMLDTYSGEMRTKAISYYGATAGIGSSLGLFIGGGLTSFVSWRAGFLINVPMTFLLMILTYRFVQSRDGKTEKIDYIGSFLSVLGLASFIYGLSADKYRYITILVGIILLVLFYWIEKNSDSPIMPIELFKNRVRFGAYLVRCLFMMAILPYWFLLPQELQHTFGYTALESGIAFLPLTITTFITALQLPKLTKRFGNSVILLVGEFALLVGLIWASMSDLNHGYIISVALPMIVIGLGQALIVAPVTTAGVHLAPDDLAGSASGLTNAMHQIGGPIGLSLIISVTSDFYTSLRIMALFTTIALVIVFIFIYRNKE
ncbi:MFS transporter [Clostridium baratii]|uniref:MFS transporter n=1 Tax=Clostridium baratii TaxID=1561 RepID=UPI003D34C660